MRMILNCKNLRLKSRILELLMRDNYFYFRLYIFLFLVNHKFFSRIIVGKINYSGNFEFIKK